MLPCSLPYVLSSHCQPSGSWDNFRDTLVQPGHTDGKYTNFFRLHHHGNSLHKRGQEARLSCPGSFGQALPFLHLLTSLAASARAFEMTGFPDFMFQCPGFAPLRGAELGLRVWITGWPRLLSDIPRVGTGLWRGRREETEVVLCEHREQGGRSWAPVYRTIPWVNGRSCNLSRRPGVCPRSCGRAKIYLRPASDLWGALLFPPSDPIDTFTCPFL